MDALRSVNHARDQLVAALKEILIPVADDDLEAGVFFTQCLHELHTVDTEDALLEVFMKLSTTAFLGFSLSPESVQRIDAVLAQAQNIAALFASDPGIEH